MNSLNPTRDISAEQEEPKDNGTLLALLQLDSKNGVEMMEIINLSLLPCVTQNSEMINIICIQVTETHNTVIPSVWHNFYLSCCDLHVWLRLSIACCYSGRTIKIDWPITYLYWPNLHMIAPNYFSPYNHYWWRNSCSFYMGC